MGSAAGPLALGRVESPWGGLHFILGFGISNPYCLLCSVKLRHLAGADPDDADLARHMKNGMPRDPRSRHPIVHMVRRSRIDRACRATYEKWGAQRRHRET